MVHNEIIKNMINKSHSHFVGITCWKRIEENCSGLLCWTFVKKLPWVNNSDRFKMQNNIVSNYI